jgi:myotubularin-related protein 6/7/8
MFDFIQYKACELKVPSINAFLTGIQASGWLKHVRSVLETANFVAQTVESGVSVVVHCSDGWDRTAQTCSLAALLLDPYYRTIDGFQALIHKEWLAFGHKFNDRCGHIQIGDSKEVAPVFTQFVDAVWQLQQQYPFDFEFNERFLLTLHDHVYSCQFGTFIGNCEKQRITLQLSQRTFSLWALFDTQRGSFVNPLYSLKRNLNEFTSGLDLDSATLHRLQIIKNSNHSSPVLTVNLCPQLIRFWRSMYNRFDVGVHPRESCADLLSVTYNHVLNLRTHIRYLESALTKLLISKSETNSNKDNAFESRLVSEDSFDGRISIRNDSSFDSIDSPLKVVQECMLRLQMQHEENRKQEVKAKEIAKADAIQTVGPVDKQQSTLDVSQAVQAIESVSLQWQSVRNARECSCGSPFDQANAMFHCWGCGLIFCVRCVEKRPLTSVHLDLLLAPQSTLLDNGIKLIGSVDTTPIDLKVGGDEPIEPIQDKQDKRSLSTDYNFSLVQLGSMSLGEDPLTCVQKEPQTIAAPLPSSSSLSSPPSSEEQSQFESSNVTLLNQFVPICNKCCKLFAKN